MKIESLPFVVSLWSLVGLSAALVAVAARALWIERREGLRRSRSRLYVVSGAFLLALGFAVPGTTTALFSLPTARRWPRIESPSPPAPAAATSPAAATAPAPAAAPAPAPARPERRVELEAERGRLSARIDEIDAELAQLVAPAPLPEAAPAPLPEIERVVPALVRRSPDPPPPPAAPPWWIAFAAACLLLAGVLALVLLGDTATLWVPARLRRLARRSRGTAEPDAARAALDEVAVAASCELFKEGLSKAGKIDEASLELLDGLDLLYLRSLCAVQVAARAGGDDDMGSEERLELLAGAARDLSRLLERAPDMGEAHYLLAYAQGLLGEWEPAIEGFRLASEKLGRSSLPYDHNESICWLAVAERRLQASDAEGANKAFEEVTRLGQLADRIPLTLLGHRVEQVREHMRARRFAEAREHIALARRTEGLDAARKAQVDMACDVHELLSLFQEGDHKGTRERVNAMLERWGPPGLPEVEPEVADDIFPAVAPESLSMPAERFRGLYFLLAVATVRDGSRGRRQLTEAEAMELCRLLQRALQFEPRHREVLAALGVLTYWCFATMRPKALEWIRAAVTMGVRSGIVRRLLERDRQLEAERRDLLDRFMSASARFLEDPTLRPQVRRALIEELGQFQEYQPLLIELEQAVEAGQRSPTLELLRERARYVQGFVSDVAGRKRPEDIPRLSEIQREYRSVIDAIEASAARLEEIERRVMGEVGKVVLG